MGNTRIEVPYGVKIASITDKGIEVYWKKVECADGYEIFRETDSSEEKVASINSSRIGTYKDASFDKEKRTIGYKVRSFLRNGEETIYSDFSKTVYASYMEQPEIERARTIMYSGSTRKIRVFYGWGDSKENVWESDNEAVATVTANGVITAVSQGICTITCKIPAINGAVCSEVVVDRKAPEIMEEYKTRYSYDEAEHCWKNVNSKKTNCANIMLVGDLMCGRVQMEVQRTSDDDWDFNKSFSLIRSVFQKSDLAMGNLETLLAAGWPYVVDEPYIGNEYNCNGPSRYLDAIKYAGFDALSLANNHNCDGGIKALKETLGQVKKYDFMHTGIFNTQEDDRYFIADVNGIKIGFLSYLAKSAGFNGKDRTWSAQDKLDSLHPFSEEQATEDIRKCRENGAEYIIVYMHWGKKNYRNVVKEQEQEALGIANAGADLIIGSNPHVLQKFTYVENSSGKQIPCYYSLGNFNAYMDQVEGNRDSVIVNILLRKDEAGNVCLDKNSVVPCHTYTKMRKAFLPVAQICENGETAGKIKQDAAAVSRIKAALADENLEVLNIDTQKKDTIDVSKYEVKAPEYALVMHTDKPGDEDRETRSKWCRFIGKDGVWSQTEKTDKSDATILFVGNLGCWEQQITDAATQNGFDFDCELAQMKPLFEQAELVVGNLETPIVKDAPYRSEKMVMEQNYYCNAPVSFLRSLKKNGIDVLTTANDHDLDAGAYGLIRTIQNIQKEGFVQTGTFENKKRKKYAMLEVNAIKVAIAAFTTSHNVKEMNLTALGNKTLINTYSEKKAKAIIADAKKDGAELVFVSIHWGVEGTEAVAQSQEKIAKELAACGADCIIGSHPHLVQKFAFVKNGDKNIPVFYSLGNFIAQTWQGKKSRAAIACIRVSKAEDGITLSCSYIPTHVVGRYMQKHYVALPLHKDSANEAYQKEMSLIQKALGKKIEVNQDIKYDILEGDSEVDISEAIAEWKYEVQEGAVTILGLDDSSNAAAYSMPKEIDGLPVRKMADDAFRNDLRIRKITLGANLLAVSGGAFCGCKNLEGFQLSGETETIEAEAFAGCEKLECIVCTVGVKEINSRAFADCTGLRSVKIADNVTFIADDAFAGCEEITFYCTKDTYAEAYAMRHGYKVVHMFKQGYSEKMRANKAKTVKSKTVQPEITAQPVDTIIADGARVKFKVGAKGKGLSYQWQYSKDCGETWTNSTVTSAQKATLSMTVKKSFDGRLFHCIVSNATAEVISAAATLTVTAE